MGLVPLWKFCDWLYEELPQTGEGASTEEWGPSDSPGLVRRAIHICAGSRAKFSTLPSANRLRLGVQKIRCLADL